MTTITGEELYTKALEVMPPELVGDFKNWWSGTNDQFKTISSTEELIDILTSILMRSMRNVKTAFDPAPFMARVMEGVVWGKRFEHLGLKPKQVVEIGLGYTPFPFALALNKFKGRFIAIDLNKVFLELLDTVTSHLKDFELRTIVASAPKIPLNDGMCDLLILNHVLEDILAYNLATESFEKGFPDRKWIIEWSGGQDFLEKKIKKPELIRLLVEDPSFWHDFEKSHSAEGLKKAFENQFRITKDIVRQTSTAVKKGGHILIVQPAGANAWPDVPEEFLPELIEELHNSGEFKVVQKSKETEWSEPWVLLEKCK